MYHYHHQHQGKNDLLSARTPFPSERHLFLQGGNVSGDTGLVLSTDAKPRLKWTQELHERFTEAVNQLGGADKATPKTVMRLMGIPGLTLYHLKSHLQKYRLSKNLQAQANNGIPKNGTGCSVASDRSPEVIGSLMSNTNIGSQANRTMQISEALQMQIEVQRRLHEQLEVQRHLQLRIEAQGKYLQSVLEKAQETLGKQNLSSAGLEAAKVQLSDLVSKVSNECLSSTVPGLKAISGSHILQPLAPQHADCSMDSCLTSCDGYQMDQEIHNISMGLRNYHGNSPLEAQQIMEDARLEQAHHAWCRNLNELSMFPASAVNDEGRVIFPVQGVAHSPSISLRVQTEEGGTSSISDAWQNGSDADDHYLEPNSKKPDVQQEKEQLPNGYGRLCPATQLDLNSHDDNDAGPGSQQFDLNGFSWS